MKRFVSTTISTPGMTRPSCDTMGSLRHCRTTWPPPLAIGTKHTDFRLLVILPSGELSLKNSHASGTLKKCTVKVATRGVKLSLPTIPSAVHWTVAERMIRWILMSKTAMPLLLTPPSRLFSKPVFYGQMSPLLNNGQPSIASLSCLQAKCMSRLSRWKQLQALVLSSFLDLQGMYLVRLVLS